MLTGSYRGTTMPAIAAEEQLIFQVEMYPAGIMVQNIKMGAEALGHRAVAGEDGALDALRGLSLVATGCEGSGGGRSAGSRRGRGP